MIHILIVEDIPETLSQLRARIQEELSEVVIRTARSVAIAIEEIQQASRSGLTFDVFVLDFKLPASEGDNPDIDTQVCKLAQATMPDALIAHITGFPEDERVKDHLMQHQKGLEGRPTWVDKNNENWPEELLHLIKSFVHSGEVARRLDRLFEDTSAGTETRFRGSHAPCSSDATHELADLICAVERHWHDLTDGLKRRVSNVLAVRETPHGGVIVNPWNDEKGL